ncbi:hypothetical protein BDV93DRAFT_518883 [Ceratobasidium sp. AG-I]|nr:hypothetical protein BDV93DRAFT_518883 [Ceratobasidium sp. AG-I]
MVQVIRPLDVHAELDAALVQRSISLFADTPAYVDQSAALPPSYPAGSLVSNSASAPEYTPHASPTERVLSRTESSNARASNGAAAGGSGRPLPDEYVKKSSKLVLDMGRRVWASRVPVYGANASVSGKVLVKKSDHALDLCVTLEGTCITTLIERGMPVAQKHHILMSETVKLWSKESGDAPQPSYDFEFTLPTYAQGSTQALPPSSYYAFLARGYLEVKYTLRVDMTRARFHRHEMVLTPIHYLPRSHSPPPTDLLGAELGFTPPTDTDFWRTIELTPTVPQINRRYPVSLKVSGLISAEFALLKSQIYTATTPIPFRLTLRASSPALALLPNVSVHLIKKWILTVKDFNVRVAREVVLGSGEIWRVEEGEEGSECERVVSGCVVGGKPGAEASWGVEGVFQAEYLIRVQVKAPEDMRSLGATLPTFFHQEVVRMTTHEYTENEMVRGQPSLALSPRCFW